MHKGLYGKHNAKHVSISVNKTHNMTNEGLDDQSQENTYREREVANPVFNLQVGEGSIIEHQYHPCIIFRVCITVCQCLLVTP